MRLPARLGAIALALVLAACSSIPIGTGGGARTLDLVNDDVASLLLAFDLPLTLEPVRDASTLTIAMQSPAGERRVVATLVPADAGDLAGTLPPPSEGRTYYLFGFSAADQQAIREAQAWARGNAVGAGSLAVALRPGLCRTGAIDPARTSVSALVALPGATALAPLVSNMPLSTVLSASGGDTAVPPCAGHSG